MRKPFVCGNWKMNKNIAETRSLCAELRSALGDVGHVEVAVAPVFLCIPAAVDALKGTSIGVSSQDVHEQRDGAFTGNVAASMLFDAGCRYVIVGHSERRQYHGETNALVAKKAAAALAVGLNPMVCVGETLAERDGGKTLSVVESQVRESLADISEQLAPRVTLAYEPVWAIGTGRTATSAQAQEVHAHIRGLLRQMFHGAADVMRIQYGGSVKADNALELMSQPDVDGALVGGASLKADGFAAIVKAAAQARGK
jgi:triosephosphate isomerase